MCNRYSIAYDIHEAVMNLRKRRLKDMDYEPLTVNVKRKRGFKTFRENHPNLCYSQEGVETPQNPYSPTTPVRERQIIDAPITEILPHLFIGNANDAGNRECLERVGVSHIVNATATVPMYFKERQAPTPSEEKENSVLFSNKDRDFIMEYCQLSATDTAHQDLAQYFGQTFQFIEDARKSKKRVLVHCQAGVSRSATIVISYLMRCTELNMLDAYKFVKSKRSIIAPNFNFMGQLLEFEHNLKEETIKRCIQPDIILE